MGSCFKSRMQGKDIMLLKSHSHQSFLEEIVNAGVHGLGAILSIVALVILVMNSLQDGHSTLKLITVTVYGVSLVLLYLISTLYHIISHGKAKYYLQILDHSAIYLLIAGTYTPFAIVSIGGVWGWTLFTIIWLLAIVGLCYKFFFMGKLPVFSVLLYLAMGWLALIAIDPILHHLTEPQIIWLILGGFCYTFGVLFFSLDHKFHFSHALWHVFVFLGSLCHFIAVFEIFNVAKPLVV